MIESTLFLYQSLTVVLGWVILHSIWQITIIALVLKLLLKWTSRYPATVRYMLSMLALLTATLWSVHTFKVEWSKGNALSYSMAETAAENLTEPFILNTETGSPLFSYYKTGLSDLTPIIEPALPYLAIIWMLGLIFFTSRIILGLRRLHYFSKEGIHFLSKKWKVRIKDLKIMSGIQRKVEVRLSELVPVPITYQFFRPIILLPVSVFTGLTDEQIEVLLLHELAHIKRHDYIANLLQSMVEVLFFYHPFIWWISKQIRLEREHCCDDRVMQLRHQPMLYAQTLTQIQGQHYSLKTTLAMSATGNKGVFSQRIFRLFQEQTPYANLRGISAALMLLFLSGMGLAFYPSASKLPTPIVSHTPILVQDTIPKIKLETTDNDKEKLPLIVIDDQAQERAKSPDFNKLIFEQHERENIDAVVVIKEIDLTSKYGSAAADGVVFIYTKNGPKEGQRFTDKLKKKLDYKAKKLEKAKAQEKELQQQSNTSAETERRAKQLKLEKLAYMEAKKQEMLHKELKEAEKFNSEKLHKEALIKKEKEREREKLAFMKAKEQEKLLKEVQEKLDNASHKELIKQLEQQKMEAILKAKEQEKLLKEVQEKLDNASDKELIKRLEQQKMEATLKAKEQRLLLKKMSNELHLTSKQETEIHLDVKKHELFTLPSMKGKNPEFFIDGKKYTEWKIDKAGKIILNIPNETIHTVQVKGTEATSKFGESHPDSVVEIYTHGYMNRQKDPKGLHKVVVRNKDKSAEPVRPLFVIDGEIFPKTELGKAYLEELYPDDIQTINVIKGNAAMEKYGEEAKDGVVEIFTKKNDPKPKKKAKKAKKSKERKADKVMKEEKEKKESQPVIALVESPVSKYSDLSIFPNPADQLTNIKINLVKKGLVKVDIYNIKGQLIKNITNTTLDKGLHQYKWDSDNQPTGTYFVHFNLDGRLISKQLMLKK